MKKFYKILIILLCIGFAVQAQDKIYSRTSDGIVEIKRTILYRYAFPDEIFQGQAYDTTKSGIYFHIEHSRFTIYCPDLYIVYDGTNLDNRSIAETFLYTISLIKDYKREHK